MWTAALEGGRLQGMEVDPPGEEVRWGSVYWAKIKTFDAAMDAVFLDLDGDNTGILYNKDVRIRKKNGDVVKGGDKPITKIFQAGDMVAVQAKTAYLVAADEEDALVNQKLARMSMDITLPGRYLIFGTMLPDNRISQRIRDKKMRKQLLSMLNSMDNIQGCILRAAAANVQTDVLVREGKVLHEIWDQMQQYLKGDDVGLIMLGPDSLQRTLSDQAGITIDRIEVVTMDHFTQADEWCSIFAPDLVTKIEPVELDDASDDLALFHYRDIIGQIEDLFQPYAVLPGGGNIIIQDTAALTAIDINRGADDSPRLAINIEAAKEIARQIRLRNTGGIIIIDFLKLTSKKDEGKLIAAIEEFIDNDPCTVHIHGMTALGLMELTRDRRTLPLQERFEGILE
ncbi:MAG: ribonuclease G [Micavibrio sp.]|nr:MAG: ribonuclease G [Micavibrio sp.]